MFNIYKLQINACYVTDYRLTDCSLQITSSQTVDHPFKAHASVKPHGPTRVAQGIMTWNFWHPEDSVVIPSDPQMSESPRCAGGWGGAGLWT